MTPARTLTVDPQTFDVFVDGVLAACEPAERLYLDPEVPAALTANGHPKGADECEPAPLSSARSLMHFPVYPVRFTVLARADSGHPGMTMGAGKLRARGNPSK